jgi:hypothetical protein
VSHCQIFISEHSVPARKITDHDFCSDPAEAPIDGGDAMDIEKEDASHQSSE